jgi:CRP-like cAMP-binding protein
MAMADKERRLKDKASKAYAEGRVKDALKIFEQIVADDPSELQVQIKIGDIYRKMGNRPSAVAAYEIVARAYADDGLLLKAVAICKLILSVDPRHTATQEMLADLYSKRRAPPRHPFTPLPGRPPPTAAIELPELDEEPEVQRTSARNDEPEQAPSQWPPSSDLPPQWPPRAPAAPVSQATPPPTIPWPQVAQGATPPPAIAWPGGAKIAATPPPAIASAWPGAATPPPAASWPPAEVTPARPVVAGWPVSPPTIMGDPEPPAEEVSIEDSVLDITVGEVMSESEAVEPVADEVMGRDTSSEIHALLAEMSDEHEAPETERATLADLDDEPLELSREAPPTEEVIELTKPKTGDVAALGSKPAPKAKPIEETWDGVIRVEDVDKEDVLDGVRAAVEEIGRTVEIDDASTDVREAPPIELTSPIVESTGDLAEELERPQIPLFSQLPKSAFIELLVQMDMRELSRGEYVIKEGEVGHSFFVIATGRVRVTRRSESGEEVTLAHLTDGAFFGEMALLQDGARTASVIVEEESQIFEISKAVLDKVVTAYPSVARVLDNFYKQRLLSTAMATNTLFKPFSQDERRQLMEMFKSRGFQKNEIILEQGKKGSGLFILLHGKLRVVKKKEDGSEVTLAELGPGDMFGEMSLLTNQPTNATISALTDCFVLRMSKKKFDEIIMTHPQILELVAQVSEERRSFNDALLGSPTNAPPEGAILV